MASASKTFHPVFPAAQERRAKTKQPAGLPAPSLNFPGHLYHCIPSSCPHISRLARNPHKSTSSSLTFMCGLAVGLMCPEFHPKRRKQRARLALSRSGWEGSAPHTPFPWPPYLYLQQPCVNLQRQGTGRGTVLGQLRTTSENHGLR